MTVSVVNVWQTFFSGTYTYGSVPLALNTGNSVGGGSGTPTAANWLFAVASWQSSQDYAVVHCQDDAHNFWQDLIVSPDEKVRTAIMCVQDMRAPTVVNFSSTAFVRDAIYTVIEVSGLQAGFILDSSVSNHAASATSVSTSQTITQADFVLDAVVFNSISGVINTTVGTQVGAAANSVLQTTAAWTTTSTSPFAETFSSSTSTSAAWGACSVAVASAAPLPLNSNPAWPVIQCQAAFGANPGDPSAYWTWTDITSRFLGISGQRGRQFELDQLEAADVTITLDNIDGALNPLNSSSPFWPNVQLITPVRLLATWQGRIFQVFNGHFEYLPQTYDFQRGMVEAQSADSFSALPQVYLQNCMEQEILFDQPWGYWPLSDTSGATQAANWSGRTMDTLNVVVSKFGGSSSTFGITPTTLLVGDNGVQNTTTVWGQASSSYSNALGSCLQVIDSAFPPISNGLTVETWILLTSSGTPPTEGGLLISLEDLTQPGLPQGVRGQVIGLYVNPTGTTDGLSLNWNNNAGTSQQVFTSGSLNTNQWYHVVLQVTSTTYKVWLNGVLTLSGSWTLWSTTPDLFSTMGQADKFNTIRGGASITAWPNASYGFINGNIAHVAVYDRIIDAERITSHYNSGANGFQGETSGARLSRLLSYARWNQAQGVDPGAALMQALNYLGQGGYGNLGIGGSVGIFGSYGFSSNSGTAVDQAVVDVSQSENGLLYVDQNGALVFRARSAVYNGPVRAAFGDGFLPVNQNVDFNDTLSPWVAVNGGTLVLDGSTWLFSGTNSAVLNGNGSTANPAAISEKPQVLPSTKYTANAWVYSPQGWTNVQILINWYDSSFTYISTASPPALKLPPATPMQISVTGTSPSNAAHAEILVQMTGTPASSVLLYFDRTSLSLTGLQVPYEEDIKINYDVTYLYNDVTILRNVDQIQARIVNQASRLAYQSRVYTRTIFTQTQNPPNDLTDMANWLANSYDQPAFRVEKMTIDAIANPDAWEVVLGLDVGDQVSFQRSAFGQPVITENFIVISISPDISQTDGNTMAQFEYTMAPVLTPVLTLDDPVYGILGQNALGW